MAIDKDKDGFKVPSTPGEIIPATLLDADDNDPKVGVAKSLPGSNSGSTGGNNADYNADTSGYVVYDKDGKETFLNNATALVKYLKSLPPATIKSLKQQYANAGMYKAPVNSIVGPSDSIVNLIGNALQYQEAQGVKTTLNQSITSAIKDYKVTSVGNDSATPNVTVTSQASATANINDAFRSMFGDSVPKDVNAAYYKELNALEMSRTSKPKTAKGVDIYTAGVSDQERQDILNKYLAQYATVKINNANTGDAAAVASLNKGTFGVTYTTLRNAYANNGIPINAKSLAQQVTESAFSKDKLESNLNLVNLQAATYFPALADKIGQGYSVKQLLTPYLNTRANILEEDPDTIDISKLTGVAKDSKSLMGLYDYEVSLRNDPKWRFTKNAQDSMSSVAQGLAKTFGLVG